MSDEQVRRRFTKLDILEAGVSSIVVREQLFPEGVCLFTAARTTIRNSYVPAVCIEIGFVYDTEPRIDVHT